MTKNALLAPGKIGTLALKNRVIMSPMATSFATYDGYVDEKLADYLGERAKGGCGLVGMEFTAVTPSGQPPTLPCIYDDSFLPGLTKVASSIKSHGGKAMIQLAHCGRQTYDLPPNGPVLAASPLPCAGSGTIGKEMTEEEIWETIDAFGEAALRAVKAGFEAIELHFAHGYLVHNFLSPYSNIRTDKWGGSFENRSRFAREILRNVRKKIGNDFPILTRVSCVEHAPGGLTLEDQIEFCEMLEKEGSDCIDVSVGVYGWQKYLIPPIDMPLALNVDNAALIKQHVNIPVAVVGRINDPSVAERIIVEGKADFVVIGRGLIADPYFVDKIEKGEPDTIVKCIGCMEGCVKNAGVRPITCLRNPATGKERDFALEMAEKPRKIMVVGGGPGGLEAATTLSRRGHDVTVFEKSNGLGGLFVFAGVAPRKGEMRDAALQMGRTAERAGVKFVMQTEVTPEIIEEFAPDVVIVASGSNPFIPKIPGIDSKNVVTGVDVLKGNVEVINKVAIIGGNVLGCEVADFLASNAKTVTVLEATDSLASDLDNCRMMIMLEKLSELGVRTYTKAMCTSINESSVSFVKEGAEHTINNVETVVVATGAVSNDTLSDYLEKSNIEYYVIGDAKKPGFAIEAIHDGAVIGRRL